MKIAGWDSKYLEIASEFGYNKANDRKSASMLNSILKKRFSLLKLRKIICGHSVFVIGAGPSLSSALPVLKKYKSVLKICADTAITPLLKNGIRPDIVVTDLDGNLDLLKRTGNTESIFVVHAHGDNIDRLEFVKNFKNCIGTTQTEKIGKIYNFGGFTDGDRCVFLANFFGASKIFLFGMDFGVKIGMYSETKKKERKIKLKKLHYGKLLLEWLAPKADSELFTLSSPIKGFKKITYKELKHSVCG